MDDDSQSGPGSARGGATAAVQEVDVRAYLYLAAMVLIGSSTAPAARYVVRELPVELIPLVRFGVAGLCLLPIVARRGGDVARALRQDGGRLALGAFCCVPLNQTFFLNAARLTATSHVALIYAAVPMIVLVLAALIGQERLRADRLIGVAASVLGVGLIALENVGQGGAGGGSAAMVRGDLLLIGAIVSWAAYLTISKPLVARHGALTVLAATFLLGTILDLPVAAATWRSGVSLATATPVAWWGLAYLTLVVTVVGLTFQNLALRRLDASQVATFGNAAPVLTVLWGVWLFGETVTPALAVGGALTLGGIAWTGRPPRRGLATVAPVPVAGRAPAPLGHADC